MPSKRSLSDQEVDQAVDSLMSSLGVPDDGSPANETGFDTEEEAPKLADEPRATVTPSAEAGALWGTPKPKKK